jgi:PAS domain S-box-containing protein
MQTMQDAGSQERQVTETAAGTAATAGAGAQRNAADAVFAGPGEMRALCRAFDWGSTVLGPVEGWPHSLRITAGVVLGSRNPMFLFWGPELVQLYNDAYRPSLGEGGRHPRALGASGREFWPDIWDTIGPQIEQVMTTGEATWHEDQYLPIERNGGLENVWWTYGYSPVPGDGGEIAGTLVVCQETTRRVLGERERERLLADTARAERRVARILEQVSQNHLTMDADFRILTVNAAAERGVGRTADELRGMTHWEAFPASVGTEAERHYRRVVAERAEAHFTHHYVGEGYDLHVEVDAYPTDEGGIALFWRDVSQRVNAERALRESEARYRALFESLDEGFCVIQVLFDDAGRPVDYLFVETNPAFEEQTGLVDARGRAARELVPSLEEHWFEMYGRVARTGEPVRFESGSDAMGRWFEVYAFRIGRPEERHVALLFQDISAARAAAKERERLVRALEVERERLAYVFQRAPAFLAVLRGPDHVFELVNDAYLQLVGHRELVGRPVREALPEVREQGFIALLDRVLATGEPFVGRELSVLLARTPGAPPEERFVDFVYLPLVEADGTRAGLIAHGTDVTAQVLARREVERLLAESEQARADAEAARAEAEAANRSKSEFLAVMSHELRTPLNAIGGYAELIEMGIRGPVTPQQGEDLRRIQTSQRHLLGLINEVLNYAKLETGTVHFYVAEVPVREAVGAAELLVAPQARAKGLALVVSQCSPELAALADGEKLRQILANLLSNAVKFTDRGGRVEIACSEVEGRVEIAVADTGIGIAADKLAAIFDPFVQVRSDLTRPHEGTGLGLAISRDLARGMGGDLTVRSTPGAGSVFTLTLPRA